MIYGKEKDEAANWPTAEAAENGHWTSDYSTKLHLGILLFAWVENGFNLVSLIQRIISHQSQKS